MGLLLILNGRSERYTTTTKIPTILTIETSHALKKEERTNPLEFTTKVPRAINNIKPLTTTSVFAHNTPEESAPRKAHTATTLDKKDGDNLSQDLSKDKKTPSN